MLSPVAGVARTSIDRSYEGAHPTPRPDASRRRRGEHGRSWMRLEAASVVLGLVLCCEYAGGQMWVQHAEAAKLPVGEGPRPAARTPWWGKWRPGGRRRRQWDPCPGRWLGWQQSPAARGHRAGPRARDERGRTAARQGAWQGGWGAPPSVPWRVGETQRAEHTHHRRRRRGGAVWDCVGCTPRVRCSECRHGVSQVDPARLWARSKSGLRGAAAVSAGGSVL